MNATCGNCQFAKLVREDFTKRFCNGAPPSPVAVPTPVGGPGKGPRGMAMSIQMVRPIVGITDEACALYRPRATIIADAEVIPANMDAAANG